MGERSTTTRALVKEGSCKHVGADLRGTAGSFFKRCNKAQLGLQHESSPECRWIPFSDRIARLATFQCLWRTNLTLRMVWCPKRDAPPWRALWFAQRPVPTWRNPRACWARVFFDDKGIKRGCYCRNFLTNQFSNESPFKVWVFSGNRVGERQYWRTFTPPRPGWLSSPDLICPDALRLIEPLSKPEIRDQILAKARMVLGCDLGKAPDVHIVL